MTARVASRQPLLGVRVLVTRARAQAGELTVRLESLGATVVELAAIEIVPAPPGPLDRALASLDVYDWIVFTSVNTVDIVAGRMTALGFASGAFARTRVAAIGRATAARLAERDLRVDFVPARFVAEAVVEGMAALGIDGARVLLPRAEMARDTLPDGLRAAGATVDVVVAYRTLFPEGVDRDGVRALLRSGLDLLTFGSPSAVRNLVALAGAGVVLPPAVCIGPVTAQAAREAGLHVAAVADEYSIPGLVDATVRCVDGGVKGALDGSRS